MTLSEVADLYIILRAVTKPFTDSMAKAGVEGEAASAKITGGIGKISPVMMGITAATGLTIAASAKWASDFETQYTRLFTAAGAAKDQVLANRDAMLKLGTATGYTGTQIAEAMYHPISAGFQMADALQMVKVSAEEARISGANLDDTTFSLSSVMRAFNQQGKDAGDTMALLNAIVGDGDMHFQDFNTSIKNWAPTAAAMGISIQSMGAGLAYLTDRGNSAEEASTRMTMGLTLMATPSAQAAKLLTGLGVASTDVKAGTEAMTEVLKKAHITQNDLAKDLQKPDGVYVALTHLKQALHDAGVSGTEADSTLSKIFGGGRSDKAILSLMQNLDGLKDKYDQIGKDSSAKQFQKDWEDTQKTTAVQFDKLKAQIINLGIQLGEVLLPPLKKVMGYISDGIGWITHHKEAMIALAGVISGVVVAALYAMGAALVTTAAEAMANPIVDILAAIALIAIEVITHWDAVKKFFQGLWDWIVAHKDIVMMVLAVMFPALTAIGVAVYEVIKHWKEIWAFLKQLGKDIAQWAKDVAKFFEHIWDDVSKWAKEGWGKAVKVSKDVWEDMKKAWDDTIHFLERIWNDTGGKLVHEISQDWEKSTSAISKEWKHISDDLSSIWDSLSSIWDHTGGKLVHAISVAMDWIGKEIHKHWKGISEFFNDVWTVIWGYFKYFLDLITGILKAAWDLIRGITKVAWDIIWTTIKVVWQLIWTTIKEAIDIIVGVLKAGWDLVKGIVKVAWDIITGIINTALDFIKDALKFFADLFSGKWGKLWGDIKKLVKDAWDNIYKLVQGTLSDILKTVGKVAKDIWDGFIKAIKDSLDGIGKALKDVWDGIVKFFKDAIHWLYQAGKDLIQGFINGIGDMADSAVKGIGDLAGKVLSSAKHGFGLWSPSRIFHGYGVNIVQGLINGMNSMSDAAAGSMADIANGVNGSFVVNGSQSFGGGGGTAQGAYAPGTIIIQVQGSVLTDRDLRDVVQEQMLRLGARYSTSYTPYKR